MKEIRTVGELREVLKSYSNDALIQLEVVAEPNEGVVTTHIGNTTGQKKIIIYDENSDLVMEVKQSCICGRH